MHKCVRTHVYVRVCACLYVYVCVHLCVHVCTSITILLEPIKENIVGFFLLSVRYSGLSNKKKKKRPCANGILNNQFVLQGY